MGYKIRSRYSDSVMSGVYIYQTNKARGGGPARFLCAISRGGGDDEYARPLFVVPLAFRVPAAPTIIYRVV